MQRRWETSQVMQPLTEAAAASITATMPISFTIGSQPICLANRGIAGGGGCQPVMLLRYFV